MILAQWCIACSEDYTSVQCGQTRAIAATPLVSDAPSFHYRAGRVVRLVFVRWSFRFAGVTFLVPAAAPCDAPTPAD